VVWNGADNTPPFTDAVANSLSSSVELTVSESALQLKRGRAFSRQRRMIAFNDRG
jgi:hypothetical protein